MKFSHFASIISGGVVLILGAILIPIFNYILPIELAKSLTLKDNTKGLTAWEHPMDTSDAYITFYVFDVQNPNDVLQGAKPVLVEKGPYVYYAGKYRTDVEFEPNGTVYFRAPRTMVFDKSKSKGSENDTFTTINVPLYTIMTMIKNHPVADVIFGEGLKLFPNITMFKNLTVYEILWGYEDPILKTIKDILDALPVPLNLPIKIDGYFGFFYQKNNTDTGLFNVNTGKNGMKDFMFINSWNKETHVPYWKSEYCNRINGTDGQVYHPFVDKAKRMYMFVSDLGRSIYLTYKKGVELEGIPLYRFTPPPELWMYEDHPENECFCVGDVCPHPGALNISACQGGAPVFVSLPHFLYGDYYRGLVEGMKPSQEAHDTYIDVEKTSGIVMEGSKRIQLNLAVERIEHIVETKNLSTLLFPVIWLDQSANINEKGIKQFKQELFYLQISIPIVAYCLIAIGSLFFLLGVIILIVRKQRSRRLRASSADAKLVDENSPLLSDDGASTSSTASLSRPDNVAA
ncbi:SCARB2 [Bugula neritina]|uniref:SCARB2 n=1 Tax=Bugula neritina TaxID=10212 RepID=A0A7J7JGG4_BUGNE|nr:SCARB2 [Bugula neritina]